MCACPQPCTPFLQMRHQLGCGGGGTRPKALSRVQCLRAHAGLLHMWYQSTSIQLAGMLRHACN